MSHSNNPGSHSPSLRRRQSGDMSGLVPSERAVEDQRHGTEGSDCHVLRGDIAILSSLQHHPLARLLIPTPSPRSVDSLLARQAIATELPELRRKLVCRLSTHGIQCLPRFFLQPSNEITASMLLMESECSILTTASTIEALSEQEALFLFGHEVGHWVLRDHTAKLQGFEQLKELEPSAPLRNRVHSLERHLEVACDRIGLLACGSVGAAVSGLLKTLGQSGSTTGLVTVGQALAEAERVPNFFDRLDGPAPWLDTHPMPALRIAALVALSREQERGRESTEAEIERLLDKMELDALKLDQDLVHRYYASVAALLRSVRTTSNSAYQLVEAHVLKLATPCTPPSLHDGIAFLRSQASNGRRVRVYDTILSAVVPRLGIRAELADPLIRLAAELDLDVEAATNRLLSAAALTRQRKDRP